MELFRNLRLNLGKSSLSGKAARTKRKSVYTNFQDIKSIGIVWDASNTEDFRSLSRFHQKMSEKNIEISIFGYYTGKDLPAQYTAIRYLNCLKKEETDFFYRPVTASASEFIDRQFDLLIDINFKNLFTLLYVSTLSRARFKVGLSGSNPETSPFDLMISAKSTIDIESYLEQVIVYLEMINSGTTKTFV